MYICMYMQIYIYIYMHGISCATSAALLPLAPTTPHASAPPHVFASISNSPSHWQHRWPPIYSLIGPQSGSTQATHNMPGQCNYIASYPLSMHRLQSTTSCIQG